MDGNGLAAPVAFLGSRAETGAVQRRSTCMRGHGTARIGPMATTRPHKSLPRGAPILVPIDGSTTALRALEHACRRARRGEHSPVVVLNVQAPLPPSRLVTRAMIEDHHERESRAALRGARALAKRLGVPVEWQVQVGPAAPTITGFARERGCAEIVMGTRGLGRLPGFVLGSTAMRVVQLSTVPVTLVK